MKIAFCTYINVHIIIHIYAAEILFTKYKGLLWLIIDVHFLTNALTISLLLKTQLSYYLSSLIAVVYLCPSLTSMDYMDCSLPDSSVNGISQARIMEYAAISLAQLVRNLPAMQETLVQSWVGKIPWRRDSYPLQYSWAFLVAQLVKNPPAMQETWVRSLGWDNPLEKGMTTHSNILVSRIPWTVYPWCCKELDTIEQLPLSFTHTYTHTRTYIISAFTQSHLLILLDSDFIPIVYI